MKKVSKFLLHCKKRFSFFLYPAEMSLTKLPLDGNNLIIPGQGEFGISDIPAGDGKNDNLFLQCILSSSKAIKQ